MVPNNDIILAKIEAQITVPYFDRLKILENINVIPAKASVTAKQEKFNCMIISSCKISSSTMKRLLSR